MAASPELSRRAAVVMNALGLSREQRAQVARAVEVAGEFDELPDELQQLILDVEDDLADDVDDDPAESVTERKVRTAAGAKKYGKPIGATITRADIAKAKGKKRKAKMARRRSRAAARRQSSGASGTRRTTSAKPQRSPKTAAALSDDEKARLDGHEWSTRRFGSEGEVATWFDKHEAKHLSDEQEDAVFRYTAHSYEEINESLRTGKSASPQTKKYIADLDSGMQPLPEDIRVTRNVSVDAFGFDGAADPDAMKSMKGKVVTDPAYWSTGVHAGSVKAGEFPSEVRMELSVPKGTPAIVVGELSHNPSESEVLLGRGQRVVITDVRQATGDDEGWLIRGVVVPAGSAEGRAAA